MEFLTCEEEDRHPELIQRIRHALYCAYHDLFDGVLLELSQELDVVRQEYPDAAYQVLVAKYPDLIKDIARLNSKVANSRRNPENRHKIYDEIYGDFPLLIEHYNAFKDAYLPEIVKMSDRMEERERIGGGARKGRKAR